MLDNLHLHFVKLAVRNNFDCDVIRNELIMLLHSHYMNLTSGLTCDIQNTFLDYVEESQLYEFTPPRYASGCGTVQCLQVTFE